MKSTIIHHDIRFVVDDIRRASQQIIAHGCNARGKINKGVAKAIREHWPEAAAAYLREAEHGYKLGDVVWAPTTPGQGSLLGEAEDSKLIAHVITQEWYGNDGKRYVSYDAVDAGLRKVAARAIELNIREIAIPTIGAGLGGGYWPVIHGILLKITYDTGARFVVYHNNEGELKDMLQ